METTGLETLMDFLSDFNNKVNTFAVRIRDVLTEELEESIENLYEDIAKDQREQITLYFNEAVTNFYTDLPDSEIGYKRSGNIETQRGGLYEALTLTEGEHGLIEYDSSDYTSLFDGSRMTITVSDKRSGFDNESALKKVLFDQAFMEGWHGGAKKINEGKADRWGQHPSTGTPYYRAPGFAKSPHGGMVWHKYGKWGKRANKSSTIPYDYFVSKMAIYDNEANLQTRYQAMANIRVKEATDRTEKKIPTIHKEVFGK